MCPDGGVAVARRVPSKHKVKDHIPSARKGGRGEEGRGQREGEGRKGRATPSIFLVSHEAHASLTGAITVMVQTSLPNFPWNTKLTSKVRTLRA